MFTVYNLQNQTTGSTALPYFEGKQRIQTFGINASSGDAQNFSWTNYGKFNYKVSQVKNATKK